jgi:Ca2+-binding RTX toxin-like protein
VFAALGAGALDAGAFHTGAVATQADDRVLYDTVSKALYYDADGVGGVAAVKFATIGTLTGTLDHTDFLIV